MELQPAQDRIPSHQALHALAAPRSLRPCPLAPGSVVGPKPGPWPAVLLALGVLGCSSGGVAIDSADSPSEGQSPGISATSGAESLLPLSLDAGAGTATITLAPADEAGVHGTFLHVAGIQTGLGANAVGLDRGQMGGARLVRFRSVGDRVLLEEINTKFRAESGSDLEVEAAAQSFATSVLFGAKPVPSEDEDGVKLNLTDFLVSDAHGIARTLKSTGQGSYRLDRDRSALDVAGCKAFPDNLEFKAVLTFASDDPGALARSTAPDGRALSFVLRQGFIRLPDGDYRRRGFDPRMGAFATTFQDYSAPLDESIHRRLAVRHRLQRDPETGAIRPIVYYVDRAAPEPIRSALVEGASWWEDAFAQAGFPGAFRVEVAPPGMDPMDVRHNVIQWVHRSTRGWSYGNAISDPRTGEIIKGHVSLGSLRVRQDRLLFEGLLGVEKTGTGGFDDPIVLSLARIRQLSAHEVGHTLGLAHNFAASSANRASVMDYPAPRVSMDEEGGIDVSDAYEVGIGAWDRHAITMLYGEIPEGQSEASFFGERVRAARAQGLRYLTDADARSAGAAQPLASLWDDGADPVESLVSALGVRRVALAKFGPGNLPEGRAAAELEEVFVPLYMHHRYAVDAALKGVAGVRYFHELNGPGREPGAPVSADRQRAAMDVLLLTLAPETLRVPPGLAEMFGPRPPGYGSSVEVFGRRAGAAFDWLGAAETLARATVGGLLNRERLLRAELQAARSPLHGELDAKSLLRSLLQGTGLSGSGAAAASGEDAVLLALVQAVVVEEIMKAHADDSAARPVREALRGALVSLYGDSGEASPLARLPDLRAELGAYLERGLAPARFEPGGRAPKTPPGSPIGTFLGSPCGCGGHQ